MRSEFFENTDGLMVVQRHGHVGEVEFDVLPQQLVDVCHAPAPWIEGLGGMRASASHRIWL